MKMFAKKVLLLSLILCCLFSMSACAENDKHTHQYVETVVSPTCTTKGYTEHKCACGDSYNDEEQALLAHSGRYQCSMCQMDFGEKFKAIVTEHGENGVFINTASNYTQKTYANDNFEVIMVFESAVGTSAYTGYLSYSSFERKWTWMLEWGSKMAMGEFESLSSASTTVPCSYSEFGSNPASMMKEIFSTMVYNANQKLKVYDASFTMENLGLKF